MKRKIKELLRKAIEKAREEVRPIHVVELIASGVFYVAIMRFPNVVWLPFFLGALAGAIMVTGVKAIEMMFKKVIKRFD